MKRISFYLVTLLTVFLLAACGNHNVDNIDTTPPSTPTGLAILNGDNVVDISWYSNPERDVAGYNVYYASDYYGKYTLIGSTKNNYFTDAGAKNGSTYYYAVTAYDYDGNESDLSKQNISSTPRPEGFNLNINNYHNNSSTSGFSFAYESVVPYTDQNTDFFYDYDNGTPYLDVYTDADIQDMGRTNDIYDIPYAPATGWSSSKDAVAIVGHTYVIWTKRNTYAKIRIGQITSDRIVFDWAYQTVTGNPQLKNVPATRSSFQVPLRNKK